MKTKKLALAGVDDIKNYIVTTRQVEEVEWEVEASSLQDAIKTAATHGEDLSHKVIDSVVIAAREDDIQ